MTREMPKAPTRRPSGLSSSDEPNPSKGEQLAAVRIHKSQASNYEAVAAIPDEQFEEKVVKPDFSAM